MCVCVFSAFQGSCLLQATRNVPTWPVTQQDNQTPESRGEQQGETYFSAFESLHFSWAGPWLRCYHWPPALDNERPEIMINWHDLVDSVFIFSSWVYWASWDMFFGCAWRSISRLWCGRAITHICSGYLVELEEEKLSRKWVCPLLKCCFSHSELSSCEILLTPDDLMTDTLLFFKLWENKPWKVNGDTTDFH